MLDMEDEDTGDAFPSYMVAANAHNIGNANPSYEETQPLGTRAYYMTASAVVSGLNSFRNTAEWAGNWFSDKDVEYTDARDVIASYDEDMAKYYDANRKTADLIGFGITSLVPGLGGVKVFNAGLKALELAKDGRFATNMARGLGVFPGSREAFIKEAAETFATSRLPFSYKNPSVIKAITAGFGQNALESLAFETAVAVTMKKNPILTDLDFGDTLSNIATGAVLGGAIGGAFGVVGTTYKVAKGAAAADLKLSGVSQLNMGAAGTRASDTALIIRNDLDTTALNAPEGISQELYEQMYENKLRIADEKSREAFTILAGGDAKFGSVLYDGVAHDPSSRYSAKLLGLEAVRPLNEMRILGKQYNWKTEVLPTEGENSRWWYAEGNAVVSNVRKSDSTHYIDVPYSAGAPKPSGGVAIPPTPHSRQYLKLWGNGTDMGKMSADVPAALHLADMGKLVVNSTSVQVGKRSIPVIARKLTDTSTLSYEEALARNIWAMDDTVPQLMLRKGDTYYDVHMNDIALLTKAYREGFQNLRVVDGDGTAVLISPSKQDLLNHLAGQKDATAQHLMLQGKHTPEQVANIVDTPTGFITGEQYSSNLEDAIFGLGGVQKQWYMKYHANTQRPPSPETVKPWMNPQHYVAVYDNATIKPLDGFVVDAAAAIRAKQEVYKTSAKNAAADTLGDRIELLPEISEQKLQGVNRAGAGAGFISFTNAKMGSIGQLFESIGSLTTKWINEASAKVGTVFTGVNYKLLNNQIASTELAAVLHKVRAAGSEHYVLEGDSLVLKKVRDYRRALESGEEVTAPAISPHVDEVIRVTNPEVVDWLRLHQQINGQRVEKFNTLKTAQGYQAVRDAEVIYAPSPNPARFKHHAFVVDDQKAISQGDTTMLYAADATALEKQIAEARAAGFSVYTPDQTASYYRARGLYDKSLSLSESSLDSTLKSTGVSAPAFPITGNSQEMLQDIMQWHAKQEANTIRDAIGTHYWREFGIIKQMSKEYESAAQAQIGVLNKIRGSGETKNPYKEYLDLAMATSRKGEYPMWSTLNDFVEEVGSKVWNTVSGLWKDPTKGLDVEAVNQVFKQHGIAMPATKAQLEAWVNHPAGNKAVSEFIQTQNAVLSSLTLRLDPINAINNAISSPILTYTETNSLLRAITSDKPELAGELTKLMGLKVAGVDNMVRSPTKLLASAYRNFWGAESDTLLAKYKKYNLVSSVSDQIRQLMEVATIKGTETAGELAAKRTQLMALGRGLVDFGEKWTGNKWAEEMNRFVSANVADQLTAPLVKAGLMDEGTALAYMNTFVNRTQGNMIAAQRPQLFQGPVGQAIGLFQSYQFNIMQQLMRYVGEGSKKDAMMLMGLQGAVFGLNGLPAFQAINQHIIGTASGNTQHTDAYTSINNAVGKEAGDWITYGIASNLLWDPDIKINLYSRGDINPRQVTVVPTQFNQIPLYSAYSRVYSAIKGTLDNVENGGDVWNSLLGGIEQQGVSRPLAGIARVARGFTNGGVSYSASGKGNIISANDLYSFANLARLSGAKPFDEAIGLDAQYRIKAYQSYDSQRRTELGEAVKSVITAGKNPTQEQFDGFMKSYAETGGKQEEFGRWYVNQIRAATTPQVNKLMQSSSGFTSAYMQSIMGARMFKTPEQVRAEQPPPDGE